MRLFFGGFLFPDAELRGFSAVAVAVAVEVEEEAASKLNWETWRAGEEEGRSCGAKGRGAVAVAASATVSSSASASVGLTVDRRGRSQACSSAGSPLLFSHACGSSSFLLLPADVPSVMLRRRDKRWCGVVCVSDRVR